MPIVFVVVHGNANNCPVNVLARNPKLWHTWKSTWFSQYSSGDKHEFSFIQAIRFIGAFAAILAALFKFSAEWFSLVLAILGILVGLFGVASDKAKTFVILYFGLTLTYSALNGFPFIGEYITTIVAAFLTFLTPVVFTATIFGAYKFFTAEE